MAKTKVLHLLSSNKFSGAENVVCQIIDMFKDDKYSMVYCSVEGPIGETLKNKDINFRGISKLSYQEIKKIIELEKPNIIHAHDIRASIWASIFNKKIKIISHIHGNHDDMKKYTFKSLLYKVVSNRFNHIFWVSQSALEDYKFSNKIKRNSSILYNVIDVKSLINKKNEDKNIYNYDVVYLGRLVYPKNPRRLIKILKDVKDKFPNLKVALIGDGILRTEIEVLVKQLGLEENIQFLGFLTNPYKILSDSKVMVMTSIYEGTPMCALEAMGMGVPIISTPTDGMRDIVKNGVTGYLSEKDEELTTYILSVIQDKDKRKKISDNVKKEFKIINNIQKYKKEIERYYNG